MKMQKVLGISFVISTFNAERTIGKLLKSIEFQNYPKNKIEILLIDGNSSDRTVEKAQSSRLDVKIVKSDYPNDPEASRFFGIRKSKFDILCFIDADNYLPHKHW